MDHSITGRLPLGRLLITTGIALSLTMPLARNADAERGGDEAMHILHAMSDYIAAQKTISLTYDSDIEVITVELQKIQFASSGQVQLSRPDKLRVSRTGGYADVLLVFTECPGRC